MSSLVATFVVLNTCIASTYTIFISTLEIKDINSKLSTEPDDAYISDEGGGISDEELGEVINEILDNDLSAEEPGPQCTVVLSPKRTTKYHNMVAHNICKSYHGIISFYIC